MEKSQQHVIETPQKKEYRAMLRDALNHYSNIIAVLQQLHSNDEIEKLTNMTIGSRARQNTLERMPRAAGLFVCVGEPRQTLNKCMRLPHCNTTVCKVDLWTTADPDHQ